MVIIIDIGGTTIKYGVIDPKTEDYQLLGKLDTGTSEQDFRMENRLEKIIDAVEKDYELKGIAISTAGVVDAETGKIIYANKNIPNYKGTNLKGILEEKYNVPVTVENDVNSALLGELNYGELQGVHSALMLTIGTGVGGALYLNKAIYHGFTHSAGEVGYALMNGKNIEETASARALVARVAQQVDEEAVDGHWIFEQAINHQHPIAIKEIDFMVSEVMHLVNNYVALINPEVVIFGGGIMEQVDYLKPRVVNKFKAINANQLVVENTKIEFASLGNQAGMLGAYVHFKNKVEID